MDNNLIISVEPAGKELSTTSPSNNSQVHNTMTNSKSPNVDISQQYLPHPPPQLVPATFPSLPAYPLYPSPVLFNNYPSENVITTPSPENGAYYPNPYGMMMAPFFINPWLAYTGLPQYPTGLNYGQHDTPAAQTSPPTGKFSNDKDLNFISHLNSKASPPSSHQDQSFSDTSSSQLNSMITPDHTPSRQPPQHESPYQPLVNPSVSAVLDFSHHHHHQGHHHHNDRHQAAWMSLHHPLSPQHHHHHHHNHTPRHHQHHHTHRHHSHPNPNPNHAAMMPSPYQHYRHHSHSSHHHHTSILPTPEIPSLATDTRAVDAATTAPPPTPMQSSNSNLPNTTTSTGTTSSASASFSTLPLTILDILIDVARFEQDNNAPTGIPAGLASTAPSPPLASNPTPPVSNLHTPTRASLPPLLDIQFSPTHDYQPASSTDELEPMHHYRPNPVPPVLLNQEQKSADDNEEEEDEDSDMEEDSASGDIKLKSISNLWLGQVDTTTRNNNNSRNKHNTVTAGTVANAEQLPVNKKGEVLAYPCHYPDCKKRFATPKKLKVHQKSHRNQRKHQCQVCNELFLRRQDLIRHSVRHIAVKQYTCPRCNSTFTRKDARQRHVKSINCDARAKANAEAAAMAAALKNQVVVTPPTPVHPTGYTVLVAGHPASAPSSGMMAGSATAVYAIPGPATCSSVDVMRML